MTPLSDALAFAATLDAIAEADYAQEEPQFEELYLDIGDLAGGLGWDLKTKRAQTLVEILPPYCERAERPVYDAHPEHVSLGMGGNDPDSFVSGWLEDAMDKAHDDAAREWLAAARRIAGPMVASVEMKEAA